MSRLLLALILGTTLAHSQNPAPLLTVAESSGYLATGRHADVVAFVNALRERSPLVRVVSMGKSHEQRDLPMLVIADPPVATPEEARRSGKLVVYAQGGIHSGECCGKEALLMLARAVVDDPPSWLEDVVLLITPLYNPDGNERVAKNNRPGQHGPAEGMGERPQAQGYDLNRDNTKLDSPEAQALSKMMTTWDPWVFIDTHTTNGSYHRNTLTFEGPVNPAGSERLMNYVRADYLPTVKRTLQERRGWLTNWYGNFDAKKTRWTSYDGVPRFGTRARGIRGIVSILTEAYSYASYKDRVLCTRDYVEELLVAAARDRWKIQDLVRSIRADAVRRGANPDPRDLVSLRAKLTRSAHDLLMPGYVELIPEGERRPRPTKEKKDYPVEHWGDYRSVYAVTRPFAYVFPAELAVLKEKLEQHGIPVTRLSKERELEVECTRIERLRKARRPFQGHRLNTIRASFRKESRTLPAGSFVVRTAHPLSNWIVYLVEAESEDGLAAWNLLDPWLEVGKDSPVLRVMKPCEL